MKKLHFLFTNGASFSLEIGATFTRKTLSVKLLAFQLLCLQMMLDHKRFASGKTSFKMPLHRPSWIGIDNGDGKIVALRDNVARSAQFKGYSIVDKVIITPSQRDENGKTICNAVFELKPSERFVDFVTNKVINQLANTEATSLGELDTVFASHIERVEAAKEARLLKAGE